MEGSSNQGTSVPTPHPATASRLSRSSNSSPSRLSAIASGTLFSSLPGADTTIPSSAQISSSSSPASDSQASLLDLELMEAFAAIPPELLLGPTTDDVVATRGQPNGSQTANHKESPKDPLAKVKRISLLLFQRQREQHPSILPYGSPLHLCLLLSPSSSITAAFFHWLTRRSELERTWANAVNACGETPLHLACRQGNLQAVVDLLALPSIDDTLKDDQDHTPLDVCGLGLRATSGVSVPPTGSTSSLYNAGDVGLVIEYYRANIFRHAASITKKVLEFIKHDSMDNIKTFFEMQPRVKSYLVLGWFDINGSIDPENEYSILHYAAKQENVSLLEWALSKGADPAVCDKKRYKPADLTKNERIRELLKAAIPAAFTQAPPSFISGQSRVLVQGEEGFPSLKGRLWKYVNYASGYKPRYFVLENGVLSYYKQEQDFPSICRGSLSASVATVTLPDPHDMARFDVISTKKGASFSLKAKSPAEAKKWVWALLESRKLSKDTSSLVHSASADLEGFRRKRSASIGSRSPLSKKLSETSGSLAPGDLDDSASSAVPSAMSLSALISSLRVHLDLQLSIVHNLVRMSKEVSENVGEKEKVIQSATSLQDRAALLARSMTDVRRTAELLISTCESREQRWSSRYQHQVETKRRWESILSKIVQSQNSMESFSLNQSEIPLSSISSNRSGSRILQDLSNASLQDVDRTSSGYILNREPPLRRSIDTADGSEEEENDDEEVFFDAQDGMKSSQNILELMFGLESYHEGDAHLTPRREHIPANGSQADSYSIASFVSSNEIQHTLGPISKYRIDLPLDPNKPKPTLAVWSFLKSAIGKDLSKLTLPVFFNEPLSMLQRMAEDIEYAELLTRASRAGCALDALGSVDPAAARVIRTSEQREAFRIALISAFGMSNYSSTLDRTNKPFNPLLGETFEFVDHEREFRYVSEQVCHHPPISACHCESPYYSFYTEVNVKSKFRGTSLEIHPLGTCHVHLPAPVDSPDELKSHHYSWKKVTTSVNNIIVGKIWIDHFGDLVVKNHNTGMSCVLTFKPKDAGWFGPSFSGKSKVVEDLEGVVKDASGAVLARLYGSWTSSISITFEDGSASIELWCINPPVPSKEKYFHFTKFALALNDLPPTLSSWIPVTDCRRRPDQRAMERGDWTEANRLKELLEVVQRRRRKEIQAQFAISHVPNGPPEAVGIPFGEDYWTPRWFSRQLDPDTQEEYWHFNGEYWKCRGSQKWPSYVFDIFEE